MERASFSAGCSVTLLFITTVRPHTHTHRLFALRRSTAPCCYSKELALIPSDGIKMRPIKTPEVDRSDEYQPSGQERPAPSCSRRRRHVRRLITNETENIRGNDALHVIINTARRRLHHYRVQTRRSARTLRTSTPEEQCMLGHRTRPRGHVTVSPLEELRL